MSDPDTIRADIEATRLKTANDVDALADKVSPHSIADRQKEKVKDRVRSARESVMGAARSASDAVPDASAPAALAKGHPMVVGLIAFGAGWLLSSLLPTTSTERATAANVKDKAAPLVDTAKEAAKDLGEHLKEPAKNAAEHVKGTASDAVATVQDEGRSAVDDVRSTAADAGSDVQDAARRS